MVKVEITAYGAKDAVLKQWCQDAPTLGLGLAWCIQMYGEVAAFCRANGAHFVDQHVYDPEQDARNR